MLKLFVLEADCFQGECYVSDIHLLLRSPLSRQEWWEAHEAVVATQLKLPKSIIFCLETASFISCKVFLSLVPKLI